MKCKFNPPVDGVIFFEPYDKRHPESEVNRRPLHLRIAEIDSKKTVTVGYIAKDGRVHRHRYFWKAIRYILGEDKIIWKRKKD